jgi:hypothetical protein
VEQVTLPIDLALLETGAAACVGGLLGLASAAARSRREPAGIATDAGRTFLLIWVPPALARLATMLPMADPRTSPALAFPVAAPASAALAVLLALVPLAYRASRSAPARRRRALGTAGIAVAIAITGIGLVASPFDSSGLADAVADHSSRCAALARTPRPYETRALAAMEEKERAESAAEAAAIHDRRGLPPVLVRLEERRRSFAASVGSAALSAGRAPFEKSPPTPSLAPRPGPVLAAGGAGCAAVEAGMAASGVEKLLGRPDQRISAEDVRGPGAERWAYSRMQCRIHLVDGIVEFVD